ncbi:MAG: M48 family metallopeptidase [Coriobacteriia bacterium]|nr:M48 family metallopeptidase [Coriobacteriia bacterium]
MHYNAVFWAIIVIVILGFAWRQVRAALNRSRMSDTLPPELAGIYDQDEYARQQQYQRINGKLGLISSSFSTSILLALLFLGAFGWLEHLLQLHVTTDYVLLPLVFLAIMLVLATVEDLPFDYYDTFVIEERFGFNKTTKKTFFGDVLKGLILSLIMMSITVGVIAFLYYQIPQWFWLIAWGVLTFFSVIIGYFYSQLIVPLFNKQTPLPEGELRDALFELSKRTDFPIKDVFVIDGSKRSTKANAYFAGFGKRKRICLYDTLIDDLSTEEIAAVLAHEIGHYKKRHVPIMMAINIAQTGFQLWLMSLFLGSSTLALALGSPSGAPSLILGLLAFSFLYVPLSELLSVGENVLSRHNEYQADAFAARYGYAKPLMEGLKTISSKALVNLTPHPVVVFWTYSHPTLLQRMKALGLGAPDAPSQN